MFICRFSHAAGYVAGAIAASAVALATATRNAITAIITVAYNAAVAVAGLFTTVAHAAGAVAGLFFWSTDDDASDTGELDIELGRVAAAPSASPKTPLTTVETVNETEEE